MRQKMHIVSEQKNKKEKFSFKIKVDQSKIPNKMHLEVQLKNPSKIVEDKRFKKPKYKKIDFED